MWLVASFTKAAKDLLEHFHKQTLQGKVAAFDFYRALELLTDNTGLSYLPVSVLIFNTRSLADVSIG